MILFIKKNIFLIALMMLALASYSINLHGTFFMASDTARDLLRTLEIWQKKEITVIGPPLVTINDKPIQVYFGSMGYYFAMIGLIVSNFDPVGSTFFNIILMIISIPFFYLLSRKILNNKFISAISTIIYALAPTTLAFARSFWYPNLIIPLSVFTWYLLLCHKSLRGYLLAGFVMGIIFNLHYLNIIPISVYVLLLLFNKKDRRLVLPLLAGSLVTLSPLILFEIKNNFFITKAFFQNSGGFSTFSGRTPNILFAMDVFLYIFGLGATDFYLPGMINLSLNTRLILDSLIGLIFLYYIIKNRKNIHSKLYLVVLTGLLLGWYFETDQLIHIRYLFSVYPLLIIIFTGFLKSINKYLPIALLLPMFILDWKIINYKVDSTGEYYSIKMIEAISQTVVIDNSSDNYNITENVMGDARALPFRYFLERDATVKPQPVENYDHITTLYVVAKSLDQIYKDDRWEFSASGPKKISWEKDFGDLKLYKFVK